MMDTNAVLRTYLLTQPCAILVTNRIYCPRAPQDAAVPNITFFTRGGRGTPYIPDLPYPSVQIDVWAADPLTARTIYISMHKSLQGLQNQVVAIGADTFHISSAIEEVHGQDLVDVDIPNRFRVLSYWEIIVKEV